VRHISCVGGLMDAPTRILHTPGESIVCDRVGVGHV